MREIGLGKELGDSPQKNVVQFIGCVTSHSKKALFFASFHSFYSRSTRIFSLFCLFVRLGKDRYLHSFTDYSR